MRQFAASGSRLWNLSREAKVIYTFFCALSLCAMASSVLLYEDLVGPSLRPGTLSRVRAYYGSGSPGPGPRTLAGAATPISPAPAGAAAPGPPATPGAGPEIALPPEAEAEAGDRLTVAVPYRKLLEVTHFHLFTVPVFLLIISHLFMLTGLSPRWKLAWIIAGWASAVLHLLAPWLVRAGAGWALAFPLSGAGLFLCSGVLTAYPVVVMWRRRPS